MKGWRTLPASEDSKPRNHCGEVSAKKENNLKTLEGGPGLPTESASLQEMGNMFRNHMRLENSVSLRSLKPVVWLMHSFVAEFKLSIRKSGLISVMIWILEALPRLWQGNGHQSAVLLGDSGLLEGWVWSKQKGHSGLAFEGHIRIPGSPSILGYHDLSSFLCHRLPTKINSVATGQKYSPANQP